MQEKSVDSDSGASSATVKAELSGASVASTLSSIADGRISPVVTSTHSSNHSEEEEERLRRAAVGQGKIASQNDKDAMQRSSSGAVFRKEPKPDGSIHHIGADGELIIETGDDKNGYQFHPQINKEKMDEPYVCTVKIPTKDGKAEETLHFNSDGKLIGFEGLNPSQSKLDPKWLEGIMKASGVSMEVGSGATIKSSVVDLMQKHSPVGQPGVASPTTVGQPRVASPTTVAKGNDNSSSRL